MDLVVFYQNHGLNEFKDYAEFLFQESVETYCIRLKKKEVA